MSCLITSGVVKTCQYSLGGLKYVYIANFTEVNSFTDSDTDGVYDSVSMTTSGTHGSVFYKFEIEKNTGSFNQELQVSNGQKFIKQSVTFTVASKSQITTDLMEKLGLAKVVVIAEDRNGLRFVLGSHNSLEASALVGNSGAAEGDASGYTVTLEGAETSYAPQFLITGTIPQ